jgi:aminoglycoside 3-N-acetyltransferase
MTSHLSQLLTRSRAGLAPAYRGLRRRLAQLDRALDRRTLSLSELAKLLEALGVASGATVLLHTSMENIGRRVPDMKPVTLIRLLQELLGEGGTLLMPTFPFRGRQRDYADRCDSFDVRRTPSQAGLVTEVFRRMPGVVRSLHPTHPIAGWGTHARDLLTAHHLGTTFGPDSPMYKLGQRGGLVVGLGTRPRDTFTILHVPEELHPATRAWAFDEQPRVMTIVDGARRIPYRFHVLRTAAERDRFERELLKALRKEGVVKCFIEGGLPGSRARADEMIERGLQLIDGFSRRFDRASVELTSGGVLNTVSVHPD